MSTEKVSPASCNSNTLESTTGLEACEGAIKEGATVLGKSLGETSGSDMQNMGQFEGGDPFLAKLQEIDRDIGKFDGKNRGIASGGGELSINIPVTDQSNNASVFCHEVKAGETGGAFKLVDWSRPGSIAGKVNGPPSARPKSNIGVVLKKGSEMKKSRIPFLDLTNRPKPTKAT